MFIDLLAVMLKQTTLYRLIYNIYGNFGQD
jgi:hypothetical protein